MEAKASSNKAMQQTKRERKTVYGPAVFIESRFAADRQCSTDNPGMPRHLRKPVMASHMGA